MKISSLVAVALLAALVSFGVARWSAPLVKATSKETTYERVIRTRTLRCGYFLWPPFVTQDLNTKILGGFNYDYAEEVGKSLGLKVTWDEIRIGDQIEALRTGRIDAVCGSEGPLVGTASAYLQYVAPMMYEHFHFYVRADDMRFDGQRERINSPDVAMVAMDGDASLDIAERFFPNAKRHSLPSSAEPVQLLLDVVSHKADIVLNDSFSAAGFMKSNPGTIRQVHLDGPVILMPNQFSVLRGEEALADMLGQAVLNIRYRGIEEAIFARIPKEYQDSIHRVAQPYEDRDSAALKASR